eukprot:26269_1
MSSTLPFLWALTICICSGQLTPPTDGTLPLQYLASFSGSGTGHVGQFSCTNNWCSTLSLDGKSYTSVVYQHQYGWGEDLMNMFSVSDNGEQATGIL